MPLKITAAVWAGLFARKVLIFVMALHIKLPPKIHIAPFTITRNSMMLMDLMLLQLGQAGEGLRTILDHTIIPLDACDWLHNENERQRSSVLEMSRDLQFSG
jgi:hypothetical protein